jgi:UDP-N-acetylmuramoyl-tripeptide--D-alanyl-D-alanine ligase
MLTATVDTALFVTGGDLLAGDRSKVAMGVCVDSRLVTPRCFFVAFPGDRVDGHDFAVGAIEDGAHVVFVTRPAEELAELLRTAQEREAAVIRVADGLRAVQDLARYHRGRLHCAVLGITGSTGKTTTKDFVAAALSAAKEVVATQGNRNNELGVPLTVLTADTTTDVLVVEMGMRGVGQIAELCEIARPTMGLLTNVGASHVELLGSQDAVADAKAELFRYLGPDGAAFLNGDDEYSMRIAESTAAPVTLYGLSEQCAVRAEDITLNAESRPSFAFVAGDTRAEVSLNAPGRHNVYNALAAAAVALHLGISADDIADELAKADLSAMRMEVFNSASGVTIVNDAYNANPTSMRAAVETLAAMHTDGKRYAVLGDMAELGSLTELAHFRIGEQTARLGISELVTVGPRALRIAEGAVAEGMPLSCVRSFESADEAGKDVAARASAGDAVLIKASRVMGLEAVVDQIVGAP